MYSGCHRRNVWALVKDRETNLSLSFIIVRLDPYQIMLCWCKAPHPQISNYLRHENHHKILMHARAKSHRHRRPERKFYIYIPHQTVQILKAISGHRAQSEVLLPPQKVRSGHNVGQINLPGVARGGRSVFQLLPNGAFSMPHL